MNYAAESKTNIKASAWTIGVHVLLFLLLLLFKFSTPLSEPVAEMGMEVNLGNSDDGLGTDQPMNTEDPAPNEAIVATASASQQNPSNDEILKTEEPDAPVINNTPVKKPSVVTTETKKKTTKSVTENQTSHNTNTAQRPRYVFNGSTGKGGNGATNNVTGTSEGNTHGNGDRGVPHGTPGASNYTGIPGSGNGISHNISGRSIIAYPPPDADFRESGKVVIRITVNRQGAIVNKQVKSANNAEIRAIALRKLDKVKFNKSEDAPEEQFGDITFVFKTRS